MKQIAGQLRLAATDVSNHLACHHLTNLELSVARGERKAPDWRAPDLVVIQELGLRHERKYLDHLRAKKLEVLHFGDLKDEACIVEETLQAMQRGADVIAQGALSCGRWFGRPDVLRKIETPSRQWNWSYEAYDCKLSRETKATTILQLSFYSELLGEIQGQDPEHMWVVTPGANFAGWPYRVTEYAAYYRYVKSQLETAAQNGHALATYPEPCAHCDICRWFAECEERRRADDHLSLVAGIRRQQRKQLEAWSTETVAKLAALPLPLKEKPLHGSREGLERIREQARVQVQGRTENKPIHELLPIVPAMGLCRLPEPSPGDMFIDLEGDPFAGDVESVGGQEYLFGFVAANAGATLEYEKRWALSAAEEKSGFEWLVDEVIRRWKQLPGMHIYHFGAYEPGAFKRLMGRYATREEEVDSMLRAGLFVDLHTVFKQALRASVEEYSLKKLEALYAFPRKTPLEDSRVAMRYVEHRLELGWYADEEFPEKYRVTMEGYNADDCFSAAALRDWLESERAQTIAKGAEIPRPAIGDGAPSEDLDERQRRVAALVAQLTAGSPANSGDRSSEQAARWMLAQLLDWHRRENKAGWWEGYRLRELDDTELMEDRAGLAGLRFVKRLGIDRDIPTDRYSFDKQETEVRCEKDLYCRGERFGCVVAVDLAARTVDVKKTKKSAALHPTALYLWDRPMNTDAHADSLMRLGQWVQANGVDVAGQFRAVRDLLLRKMPRLSRGETLNLFALEEPLVTARRIASALDHSLFAIQGPPGAGKTYTGARMICKLVSEGKRVGITALSHKVIRKLLEEVLDAAEEDKIPGVRCMQKLTEEDELEPVEDIAITTGNDEPLTAFKSGAANVVGGTSWLWTRPEYFESVDALFIDEAGQMALADVVAVGQAAKNLLLIGDPQQLERPVKGSHPDGAEKSALEHLIGSHKTIPPAMGMLLPETWRMHPDVCKFTSEMFYEGRLQSRDILKNRVLADHPWLKQAGLWFLPVQHEGNRNSSAEEVDAVAKIVESVIGHQVLWFRGIGRSQEVELDDILIVAPYNAQVSDLLARLPQDARVGTVDKFQGQEAPIVIYSLTTSSPEDAPRGMEFLYSLNRFNVATSRAMSAVIVVGSPKLFEPDCKSPRQMQLANALCRYLEMATPVDPTTL
jgi:predicted RecB family nuclease